MGTEAVWVPLVLAAVGTAATVYNTKRTAKKQDQALAQQIDNQSKKNKEADEKVKGLVDKVSASNPQAERAKALAQYTAALQQGQGPATAGLGPVAGANERFNEEAVEAAAGVADYGADRAGTQSTIDAAFRQRQNEGFDRARTATDISLIDRAARARAFIDGLKVSGIQRNPYIDAGAGMLQGAAGSWGGTGTGTSANQAAAMSGATNVGNTYFGGGGMSGWRF